VDVCALQRPFDRAHNLPEGERAAVEEEFRLDVDALKVIVVEADLIASPMHRLENGNCSDPLRRAFVDAILDRAPIQIPEVQLVAGEAARLRELTDAGLRRPDALHLLYAETSADMLVTVDTRFLTAAKEVATISALSLQEAAATLT
jgi:hypothetical protein